MTTTYLSGVGKQFEFALLKGSSRQRVVVATWDTEGVQERRRCDDSEITHSSSYRPVVEEKKNATDIHVTFCDGVFQPQNGGTYVTTCLSRESCSCCDDSVDTYARYTLPS